MKILIAILISGFLIGWVGTQPVQAAEPIIDTTSFATIGKSIAAAKPEDQQIVGLIPCDLGHKLGLDPSDPKQRELLLEQLRIQFRGKTVAEVATEVRARQKSESDQLQKFASDYVREHQAKWKNRAEHISSVTNGTSEEDVLKYFGKPDGKSDTETTKNWVFWISSYVKDDQICADMIVLKIESGAVVNLHRSTGYRQNIADVYKESQKTTSAKPKA